MRFEELHESLADRAGRAEDGDGDALGSRVSARVGNVSVSVIQPHVLQKRF